MKKRIAAAEITHTAAENAAAMLNDAKGRVTPLVDQGREKLAPLVNEAKDRGTEYAGKAAVAVAPAVVAVKGAARDRYEYVIPKLSDALENLANNPNLQEAESRALAAVKALQGDLRLSKKDRKKLHKESLAQIDALRSSALQPKRKKKSTLLPLLLLGVLGAVAYLAYKKLFAPQETDWQTHTASAYASPTESTPSQSFGEPVDAPAGGDDSGPAAPAQKPQYGEGAYVGAEPPEGYTIKGNERSMKYHTPETGGYERTIADVWFDSESAAEGAGFAKAQR